MGLGAWIGIGIAAAAVAAIVLFRKQIEEGAASLGAGFASLGTGIQTGVGAILSPQVSPSVGLQLGGVLAPPSKDCYSKALFVECEPGFSVDFWSGTCCPTPRSDGRGTTGTTGTKTTDTTTGVKIKNVDVVKKDLATVSVVASGEGSGTTYLDYGDTAYWAPNRLAGRYQD